MFHDQGSAVIMMAHSTSAVYAICIVQVLGNESQGEEKTSRTTRKEVGKQAAENDTGTPEIQWSARPGQRHNRKQDAQNVRPARPQRVKGQGVPSGAHGATNKEHQVCARRRVGEAAGSSLRV